MTDLNREYAAPHTLVHLIVRSLAGQWAKGVKDPLGEYQWRTKGSLSAH